MHNMGKIFEIPTSNKTHNNNNNVSRYKKFKKSPIIKFTQSFRIMNIR